MLWGSCGNPASPNVWWAKVMEEDTLHALGNRLLMLGSASVASPDLKTQVATILLKLSKLVSNQWLDGKKTT